MPISTQVTKTIVTRSWKDIDPKIAVVAAVVAVADIVLVALYLVGAITADVLASGLGPSSIAVVAGYVKRSTHVDLPAIAESVADTLDSVAPIVKAASPESAAIVDEVVDGVTALEQQLTAPAPTVARATPVAPTLPSA